MSAAEAVVVSPRVRWISYVLSVLPALLLTFSGVMKLRQPEGMADGFKHLGWDMSVATGLGIVELIATALYLVPKTSVLGAILLTGYLGGAIATHLRIGEPWYMPAVLGVVLWVALYLREPRLRALAPLKQ